MDFDDITIEIARLERRAVERVRLKMAAQQLGEAWVDLIHPEIERRAGVVPLVLPSSS